MTSSAQFFKSTRTAVKDDVEELFRAGPTSPLALILVKGLTGKSGSKAGAGGTRNEKAEKGMLISTNAHFTKQNEYLY